MDEKQLLEKFEDAYGKLRDEISRIIIGQDEVIVHLLTALFSGGHCLLVGVPGLAKTLLVSTVAKCLNLQFSRVQFTPDLMPGDIIGTEVLQEDKTTGNRVFRFIKGPVFTNVLLADEINRTPPKTQAALLQAMQELEVTIGGKTHKLNMPFFVLATQNPIELEGTYPLPEAHEVCYRCCNRYPKSYNPPDFCLPLPCPKGVQPPSPMNPPIGKPPPRSSTGHDPG